MTFFYAFLMASETLVYQRARTYFRSCYAVSSANGDMQIRWIAILRVRDLRRRIEDAIRNQEILDINNMNNHNSSRM